MGWKQVLVRLNIHADTLLQLLNFRVVMHNILAIDKWAKEASGWVLILQRRRLLHHESLELLGMQA